MLLAVAVVAIFGFVKVTLDGRRRERHDRDSMWEDPLQRVPLPSAARKPEARAMHETALNAVAGPLMIAYGLH